jgi:hypothetical protein
MTVPIAIETEGSALQVVLLRATVSAFADPFFVDTLSARFGIELDRGSDQQLVRPLRCDKHDSRLARVSLDEFIRTSPGTGGGMCGLIFHTARCGSTLLSQMLMATRRFAILSEPPIVNQILDPFGPVRAERRWEVLRAALAVISHGGCSDGLTVVVKCRSWNALYVESILRAVPDAPWIFMYRRGVEVLASVLQDPPGWLRARRMYAREFGKLLGVSEDTVNSMGQDEYAARMIGAICRQVCAVPNADGFCVDYESIERSVQKVATHFGCALSQPEQAAAIERMTMNAKRPLEIFIADAKRKRQDASVTQRLLAAEFIDSWRANLQLSREH